MRATAIEFRLRMAIMVAILVVGFWAPWIAFLGLGRRYPLLEWVPLELSRSGLVPFAVATPLVIIAAALIAALAAILRLWATAYLGVETVNHLEMQAGRMMADGPYRFVRNPLYLGSWLLIGSIAFLMPPSGAVFTMVLLAVFLLRLILAEEAFLQPRLGESYRAYLCAVPRLVPRLHSQLPPAGQGPHWGRAVLAEINPIGVFLVMAVLSWNYDEALMVRAILVSFGISLVVRALLPSLRQQAMPVSGV